MLKCSSCDADLVKGAKFCIVCGTSLDEAAEESKVKEKGKPRQKKAAEKVCVSCKAPLKEGVLFCVSCGVKTSEPQVESTQPLPREDKRAAAERCASCKTPLKEGALFCVSCGYRVGQSQEEPAGSLPPEEKKENSEPPVAAGEQEPKEGAADSVAGFGPVVEERKQDDPVDLEAAWAPSNHDIAKGELNMVKNWQVTEGEEQDRQADNFEIIQLGKGVVSRITFQELPQSEKVVVTGKVNCHGCRKQARFTITSHRGWGGANDPVICPCGNSIVIGEFWNDSIDAVFVWASLDPSGEQAYPEYPLSISISDVANE